MKTSKLINLEMNPEVYALRRRVIELIYEAKQSIPHLPRITVRITANSNEVRGVARMNGNIIWIPANSVQRDLNDLRRTVFHEIAHAAFGVEHVDNCLLMHKWQLRTISKQEAHDLLKLYSVTCSRKKLKQ